MQDEVAAGRTARAVRRTALGAPHALRDRADAAAVGRVEVQDPVGLAVADRAQDTTASVFRTGRASQLAMLAEVMPRVIVYTTDPCSFCRAKALLDKRGVAYDEVNLAKDPAGRAELSDAPG